MAQSLKARLATAEATIVTLNKGASEDYEKMLTALNSRTIACSELESSLKDNKKLLQGCVFTRESLTNQLKERNLDYKSLTNTYTTAGKQVEELEELLQLDRATISKQGSRLASLANDVRDLKSSYDSVEKLNIDWSTKLDAAKDTIKGQKKSIEYRWEQLRRAEKDHLACSTKLVEANRKATSEADSAEEALSIIKLIRTKNLTLSRQLSGHKSNAVSLNGRLANSLSLVEKLKLELAASRSLAASRLNQLELNRARYEGTAESLQHEVDYSKQLADGAIAAFQLYRSATKKKMGVVGVVAAVGATILEAFISGTFL